MKLRLLITEVCNRRCEGCCNKQYDLASLPVCESYKGYESIMLTGGEPMLFPELIKSTVADIREQTDAPIYLYTAKVDQPEVAFEILELIDGMTLTLHERKDITPWWVFDELAGQAGFWITKSLRLNAFREASKWMILRTDSWKARYDMEWIEDCPLPEGEVFQRLRP